MHRLKQPTLVIGAKGLTVHSACIGCIQATALSLLLLVLVLAACSPALNWRNAPLADTPLQALMPCKPERGERLVPLADPPVMMRLQSCEASGMHFVLAWVDVRVPAQLPVAVDLWRQGSMATLGLAQATDSAGATSAEPALVVGAERVWTASAEGRDAQSRPWQTQAMYFTQGTRVYQAAVYGAQLSDEAMEAFFSELKLR